MAKRNWRTNRNEERKARIEGEKRRQKKQRENDQREVGEESRRKKEKVGREESRQRFSFTRKNKIGEEKEDKRSTWNLQSFIDYCRRWHVHFTKFKAVSNNNNYSKSVIMCISVGDIVKLLLFLFFTNNYSVIALNGYIYKVKWWWKIPLYPFDDYVESMWQTRQTCYFAKQLNTLSVLIFYR